MIPAVGLAAALRRSIDLRRSLASRLTGRPSDEVQPAPRTFGNARQGLVQACRTASPASYRYAPEDGPRGPRSRLTVGAVFRLRSTNRVYAHVWSPGRGWRTHRVDRVVGPVTVAPLGKRRRLSTPPGFRRAYYRRVGTLLASIT